MRRQFLGLLCLLVVLQILTVVSFAEQLPVKTYTTGEGLPRDEVTLVRRDSRGFIWLAAGDGISRFDGYKFRNYTTDDGLADRRVNDLLETRSGVYWIATAAGLCRFNPTGMSKLGRKSRTTTQHDESDSTIEPMFVVYNPTEKPIAFNALREDGTGAIWCGTEEGLYRLEISPDGGARFHFIELGEPGGVPHRSVGAILKDRQGALWCGVGEVLDRLLPDGRVEHYSQKHGLPHGSITSLLEDREGNIWAGTRLGLKGELVRLVAAPDPSRPIVARIYGVKDGLAAGWINSLLQSADGKLWAATTTGLYLISPSNDASEPRFQLYDAKNGLCTSVSDVMDDRDGNLWVATACGAQKVARNGFTGFGLADGLGWTQINSIFENREGALCVIGLNPTKRIINIFDGVRFQSVEPNLPSSVAYPGWGWGQTIIQDHLDEWWITNFDVYRFPKVDRIEELTRAHPQFMRTVVDDSKRTEVFRLYEDLRGDVWMATTGSHFSLLRWERATGIVHDHTAETGVPPNTDFTAFREDRAGNLWIGTGEGGVLLRYRDSKFRRFTSDDGIPPGWIIWLYLDHGGRLWIASQLGGLNRIDDPTADALRVTTYTTADGLSSNNIRAITEDEWGRIYVGTGHGVDRLDLATGGVKHFTVADGLPKGIIEHAYRDRQGVLWFGSWFGLSRLIPKKQESLMLPSVYVTGLRIEGVARPVSELGATDLPTLELSPNQRQVGVDFVGLGASLGEELRYQYHLEGANEDWSEPTTERTINFASLAPGAYRFRVRALDADGRMSSNPATFAFKIAAPVWQRWWFLSLIVALMGLTIYCVYRFRLSRLLELERIRTRIATDLHDDVGSGLSQVSILSEVISRRVGPEIGVAEQLSIMGSLSRDLVDSMSDIVWAINPGRDRLSDLSHRMRRFASDVFTVHGAEFIFDVPHPGRDLRLGPEMRRELYLIFKEAVNNVVCHSGCTAVKISFLISDGALELSVHDNGVGFDPAGDSEGNGLANMRLRATKLGGELGVSSNNGDGTAVHLKAPLDRHRWFGLGLKGNRR
jgi:ligand-binding sensor domain-containing protein/signal transduction histidine kinase